MEIVLNGLRHLAGAALRVFCGLVCLGGIVTEERELRPFASNELQDFLIGRLRAEDDASDAVPSVLDMFRQSDPKLTIMKFGQSGRHTDLHG